MLSDLEDTDAHIRLTMAIPNLRLLISRNMEPPQITKIRVRPTIQKSPAHTTINESIAASSTIHFTPTSSRDDQQQFNTSNASTSTPSTTVNLTKVPTITSVTSLAHTPNQSHKQEQTPSSSSMGAPTSSSGLRSPASRPMRRRIRRRGSTPDDQAEQLTEMSVRGLNLFRYASILDGVYKCTECAKENMQKTFKNKYSFQRHAFLYHEGAQRKVFPCPICNKEFSRPDKMKNHLKTSHECFMAKEPANSFPLNFLIGSGGELPPGLLQIKGDSNGGGSSDTASQLAHQATMEYLRQQSAENSLQLQMIGMNSALSMQLPKLESLLPTTQ